MKRRTKRSVAIHEAAHAVAHCALPLAGRVERVTIDGAVLVEHNSRRHRVNHASGLCVIGAGLPSVRGGIVIDREQLHAELVCKLAGPACDALVLGVDPLRFSRRARAFTRRHETELDFGDDVSAAFRMLAQAEPLDVREVLASVLEAERGASPEELLERYGRPAALARERRLLSRLEELLAEARVLLEIRWPVVIAIGEALLARATLEGEEVAEIVAEIDARLASGPRLAEPVTNVVISLEPLRSSRSARDRWIG